jgi:hypothetical protein
MGYIYGAALLAFLGLGCLTLWYRAEAIQAEAAQERVEQELTKAVTANKKNQQTISTLQKRAAEERAATEKEIAASQSRDTAIDTIRKDMDNVEGASALAGPYWDAFGEQLRHAKRNH